MKQKLTPLLVAVSEGINIPLDKPIVLIGRHQECDIQIPSSKISRRHCCIALVADHLVIRDLGSTNGIRINGVKVVGGNLQANDELIIGNMCYLVKLTAEADSTVRAQPPQGIKAGNSPIRPGAPHDVSYDMPMPLSDHASAHPVLKAEVPLPKAEATIKPGHLGHSALSSSGEFELAPVK